MCHGGRVALHEQEEEEDDDDIIVLGGGQPEIIPTPREVCDLLAPVYSAFGEFGEFGKIFTEQWSKSDVLVEKTALVSVTVTVDEDGWVHESLHWLNWDPSVGCPEGPRKIKDCLFWQDLLNDNIILYTTDAGDPEIRLIELEGVGENPNALDSEEEDDEEEPDDEEESDEEEPDESDEEEPDNEEESDSNEEKTENEGGSKRPRARGPQTPGHIKFTFETTVESLSDEFWGLHDAWFQQTCVDLDA